MGAGGPHPAMGGIVVVPAEWAAPMQSRPGLGRIDFDERKSGGEQLADDFFALDDKPAEGLAIFLFAQGEEALEGGLG